MSERLSIVPRGAFSLAESSRFLCGFTPATGACAGDSGALALAFLADGTFEPVVARVRQVSDIPAGVGLGVRSGAQAAAIGSYADGVIVGSALVSTLGDDGVPALRALTAELAAGVRQRG